MTEFDFEEIFASIVANSSLEIMRKNIMENVDLAEFCEINYSGFCAMARSILELSPELASQLAEMRAENVLNILMKKRYDLYREIILNPHGRAWFEAQVQNFRRRFLRK